MADAPLTETESAAAFRRLAETQAAHAAADAMVAVALADTLFFAVPLGEAREKIALYLALTMAPFAIVSPVVGPWLDRRRGSLRLAIVLAALGRAAFAILLSSRTDRLELYPLAFGLLVLSRVHGVSRSALVPEVTAGHRPLVAANARLSVISVLVGAAGAGVAAGLTRLFAPDVALWTAAIVLIAGSLTGVQLPSPASRQPRRPPVHDYRSLLSSRLLAAGLAIAASRGALGFLTFFLAFLLREEGEGGVGFAVVLGAAGAGGFVAALVAPALRALLRESPLIVMSLVVAGGTALWAATRFDVTSAAILAGVVALAAGTARLAFDSVLQHDVPEAARGRTFARYEGVFQLAWVAGAALATVLPVSAATGFRTLAGICATGAVLAVRGFIRGRREARSVAIPE